MTTLNFAALRSANIARLPTFRNKHGDLAHSKADGSDWAPAQWLQAVVGELGEYANIRKKFERGDLTLAEYREAAAKELADVQTYLDLLALRCLDTPAAPDDVGINLGEATIAKFNEVSTRVNSPIRIEAAAPTGFDLLLNEEAVKLFQQWAGGDDSNEPSEVRLQYGDGHSGRGLYISLAEYPEEGSSLLVADPLKASPAPATALSARQCNGALTD